MRRNDRKTRNRKGVFVVLFGILFMSLMGAAAISIDFARIWSMRNEFQTAADAASLAGAVQIGRVPNNTDVQVDAAARALAAANPAMGATVVVDDVVIGNWTDTPPNGVWTPLCRVSGGACVPVGSPPSPMPAKNAVRTVVSHATNNLIMGAFGIAAPTVHAYATAWADAPVAVDNCIRPWSIPYVILMKALNQQRGILPADSPGNLTRNFDQAEDMKALREMSETARTFTLKLGGGAGYEDPPPGATAPGNYQAIKLPKAVDGATGVEYPEGDPGNGAADYEDHIAGRTCHSLASGNVVEIKTGNMAEPTVRGAEDGPCKGTTKMPANGDCIGLGATEPGVPVKAAFHLCTSGCNGSARATVKLLGSFTLTKVYPGKYVDPDGTEHVKAEIKGFFNPIDAMGPVGGAGATQVTIILVK